MNKFEKDFLSLKRFTAIMHETREKLKELNEIQSFARFQFGDNEKFKEFTEQLSKTNGWVNSNC